MSRLLLHINCSPSRPWLFTTMHANRERLAEKNIAFGPLGLCRAEYIPAHTSFWGLLPQGGDVPSYREQLFKTLAQQLDSGQDVLLFSWTLHPDGHKSIASLLQKYINLTQHDVNVLFILGQPGCIFEQKYRQTPSAPSKENSLTYAERLISLPSLITYACQVWGADKVTLLADTSTSPVASAQEKLCHGLFSWLGCPDWSPPARLPRHPLFLGSLTARRLIHTLEVRENAWPPLDEGVVMNHLLSLDPHWGAEPVSPKHIRDIIIQRGADSLRELEEMLALQSGSLDCPDWLAEQPEADRDAPLAADRLQSFAASLPPNVSRALYRRFANDRALLTADQKAFSQALSGVTPGNDMGIGEPVPPVALTVLTMAYNHEKYIAECIESVLAQKTSFPVRHIVLDHCSTDDTPKIIAGYAEKYPSIQPVLLSQRGPSENVMGLFLRCHTQYAALCDGDDYFIDPLKLQKQIDFLESHPRCALCFHPVAIIWEGKQKAGIFPPSHMLPRGVREEYYLSDLIKGNMIQTNSVVYRWRFQDGIPEWFRPDLCPGDWYWHLLHAEQGKIGFLPELMSVYRRHDTAMYKDSFVNTIKHRSVHGLAELETYKAVNQHFNGRYYRNLSMLANDVFSNYLQIYVNTDDKTLLDQAYAAYPEFAKTFLSSLKDINITLKHARV